MHVQSVREVKYSKNKLLHHPRVAFRKIGILQNRQLAVLFRRIVGITVVYYNPQSILVSFPINSYRGVFSSEISGLS